MDPSMSNDLLTTDRKALLINLDQRRYGTFAEIGAGQEVVRWFFHVGGAAGTIAKSMSAYDMAVSDAIYGTVERYVCRSSGWRSMLQPRARPGTSPACRIPAAIRHASSSSPTRFPPATTRARTSATAGWACAVPGLSPPRPGQPDHHVHVRMLEHRQRPAAGSPGDRRRQSALRGVLSSPTIRRS